MHIEEYRFQVRLNTQRFQWYAGLDVALITIGTGLLRIPSPAESGRLLIALVFLTGLALAAFTVATMSRSVNYQHRARQQAIVVADKLGMSDLAVSSTAGWQGAEVIRNQRWPKVRTMNYGLLGILGLVNIIGIVYVTWVV